MFPRSEETRWWNELFGRTDDEMNSKPVKPQPNGGSDGETDLWTSVGTQSGSASMPISRARTPVLVGVETSEASIGLTASPQFPEPVSRIRTPVGSVGRAASPKPEESLPKSEMEIAPVSESEQVMKTLVQDSGSQKDVTIDNPPPNLDPTTENEEAAVAQLLQNPEAATTNTGLSETPLEPEKDAEVESLADDLDPLGIGDVRDHVPQSKRAHDRRREQMDLLLK